MEGGNAKAGGEEKNEHKRVRHSSEIYLGYGMGGEATQVRLSMALKKKQRSFRRK